MDKKEIQDITREYFKSIGFQTFKKTKFYYESKDLVIQVWMNHSNFSNLYYIDYYFRIKALHPEIESILNDDIWDTLGGRLGYDSDKCFVIEYNLWTKERYLADLSKIVKKSIIPIMKEGISYIKKLAKDYKSVGAWIVFREDMRNNILELK